MVLLNDQPSSPPSWVLPIALGAAFALLSTAVVQAVAPLLPGVAQLVFGCCCMPLLFVPQGILPAWFAFHRDRHLTPGNGFVVSFIAVGLGLILVVAVFVMTFDPDLFERELREGLRQNPEFTKDLSESERDEMVQTSVAAAPYGALFLAAGSTVLAAFVGMATILVLRRKPAAIPPTLPPVAPS